MNDALLAAGVAMLAVCWGVLVFALSRQGTMEVFGVCAPARYDSLTGQPAAARRRIVVELGPPACAALQSKPQPRRQQALTGEPEPGPELPLAVPIWPIRQPVEQRDSAPVIVGRLAARFAALEIKGE